MALALLALPAGADAREPEPKLEPETVMRLLRAEGSRALSRPDIDEHWDDLLRGIAGGSDRWLDVAVAIVQSGGDAETAETIDSALGEALPRATLRILGDIEQGRLSMALCGNSFGDSGLLGAGATDARRTLESQRRAVAAVTNGASARVRQACLAQIDSALAGYGK